MDSAHRKPEIFHWTNQQVLELSWNFLPIIFEKRKYIIKSNNYYWHPSGWLLQAIPGWAWWLQLYLSMWKQVMINGSFLAHIRYTGRYMHIGLESNYTGYFELYWVYFWYSTLEGFLKYETLFINVFVRLNQSWRNEAFGADIYMSFTSCLFFLSVCTEKIF